MLSNAYFLAKFRFDTAENEPAKNLQIFEKCIFEKCIFKKCIFEAVQPAAQPGAEQAARAHELATAARARTSARSSLYELLPPLFLFDPLFWGAWR